MFLIKGRRNIGPPMTRDIHPLATRSIDLSLVRTNHRYFPTMTELYAREQRLGSFVSWGLAIVIRSNFESGEVRRTIAPLTLHHGTGGKLPKYCLLFPYIAIRDVSLNTRCLRQQLVGGRITAKKAKHRKMCRRFQ